MIFLVAEDNRAMRESISRFLAARIPNHHAIYEAADGSEAIELFERVHPDWVFMDIEMEPMDGLTASRAIRRAHPDARIIILTGYDNPAYRKAAEEAGTRAFLMKDHLSDIFPILYPFITKGTS